LRTLAFGLSLACVLPASAQEGPNCPFEPSQVVDIHGSDAAWRNLLVSAVGCPNTLVRLGPDVDMSFEEYTAFPIQIRRCVQLVSVASFEHARPPRPDAFICRSTVTIAKGGAVGKVRPGDVAGGIGEINEVEGARGGPGSARTPRSLGPRLRLGNVRTNRLRFFQVDCAGTGPSDGVRIAGFRIEGPDQGPQEIDQTGIHIDSCVGIEIGNMEISGWGGSAISVIDAFDPELAKATNEDGGRITRPDQVKIFGSYLHHNQHPSSGGHAGGYGIDLGRGAWAQISHNVFDHNRHAIATNGNVGGYVARQNLVLENGGIHGRFAHEYTHQFDVHGTDHCTAWPVYLGITALAALLGVVVFFINPLAGAIVAVAVFLLGSLIYYLAPKEAVYNCGYAGFQIDVAENAFHYHRGAAISIRGTPRRMATIRRNVFPHDEVYDTGITLYLPFTDAAVHSASPLNVDVADNVTSVNTSGDYAQCDFDGDGVDDLFLATGVSWWYSSTGQMHWSYLNAKGGRRADFQFGDVNADGRCDVRAGGKYVSGGYGNWIEIP
jgi:hypothetical protein